MKSILGAVAVLAMSTAMAFGQTTSGDLVGSVKDASGALVPNVAVVITNEDTGVALKTTANAVGQYRASNLLPGKYDIQAEAKGFQPTTVKDIAVDLNKTATADVTLGVS